MVKVYTVSYENQIVEGFRVWTINPNAIAIEGTCPQCGNGPYRWIKGNECDHIVIECVSCKIGLLVSTERIDAKPPLGLFPKKLWQEQRHEAVKEAVIRYISENKAIPSEWIAEYHEYLLRR